MIAVCQAPCALGRVEPTPVMGRDRIEWHCIDSVPEACLSLLFMFNKPVWAEEEVQLLFDVTLEMSSSQRCGWGP